jgi:hypothetical protein
MDDTVSRVDAFSDRLTIKRIDKDSIKNIGALKSFERLMQQSTAECVMFCDQDDIWNENKIERSLYWYSYQKKRLGDIPLLCFSDLVLIDNNNNIAGHSLIAVLGINLHCINDPYYLVFRNPAPGCSMIINRNLIKVTLPFNNNAFMHDWWLIIDARLQGNIFFINEQLVRYRVHNNNALGVKEDRPLPPLVSLISFANPQKLFTVIRSMNRSIRQGKALFKKNGRHFSSLLYWVKFILGRYLMPSVVQLSKKGKRFSWKAPKTQLR